VLPVLSRIEVQLCAAVPGFPCVVKVVSLSASQGVLRADDAAQAVQAATRIRCVLAAARPRPAEPLLVEEYLPGPELSIDGLLAGGELTPVAVFDKPVMTDGPTFEETLLVTPSRLAPDVIDGAVRTARHAARALGLRTWAVHAELRVTGDGPAMLELAARSIGSLCSRALRVPAARAWKSSSSPAPSANQCRSAPRSPADPAGCSCSRCRGLACCAPSRGTPRPRWYPGSPA
jgi:formate-dependent phosphoribosylglycinamide formyltransferase (GAR transformylase)